MRALKKIERLSEQLEAEKKQRKIDHKRVKRKTRAALRQIDEAISHSLQALAGARVALAMASSVSDAPEAPGSDVWLTAEQVCIVLGGISYSWLKQLEQEGRFPRGVTLEKVDKTRKFHKLSWCMEYLERAYNDDPEAFALALLRRARKSKEQLEIHRARREIEDQEAERSGLGVMELTGSEVF